MVSVAGIKGITRRIRRQHTICCAFEVELLEGRIQKVCQNVNADTGQVSIVG